ncbi:pirin family protein [Halobacteriovorax sp. GB3]|uniref:pirin family protein n=1 Tax=Halobacteriovorax sp. GB3 TaxID=2719615 RepID=UPI00235ECD2B|nr:pirin family protein [Halobacteriovorax sp. GB3]MDD0851691.1 pirin family protein [Halobacteriovorax sp. GB3]
MTHTLHKANTRGHAEIDWLKSDHTFSFSSYYDPDRMNFGTLRVINDDIIAPSMGFGTHPHRNMEIISVPIRGALKHKDTMNNEYVIRKGEIQTMSAGRGVAHSEFNASASEEANFLQIWVLPKKMEVEPSYSQKEFDPKGMKNNFQLIVSPDGRDNSAAINQDAYFSQVTLDEGKKLTYQKYEKDNGVYFFVIKGDVEVDGVSLKDRDGLGIEDIDNIEVKSSKEAEILVMEVPMLD